MSEPGHVDEPGGVVVQTEGGDPEPVDVMRRGRDVVLAEDISAETGVNQRPAPPTPRAHCLINNVTGELTVRSGAAIPNRVGIADGRTDQHGYAARDHGGGGRPLSISGADG